MTSYQNFGNNILLPGCGRSFITRSWVVLSRFLELDDDVSTRISVMMSYNQHFRNNDESLTWNGIIIALTWTETDKAVSHYYLYTSITTFSAVCFTWCLCCVNIVLFFHNLFCYQCKPENRRLCVRRQRTRGLRNNVQTQTIWPRFQFQRFCDEKTIAAQRMCARMMAGSLRTQHLKLVNLDCRKIPFLHDGWIYKWQSILVKRHYFF